MFVFTTTLIIATWFVSRLVWDHVLRPRWRADPARARMRFFCITGTGLVVAASGVGYIVSRFY